MADISAEIAAFQNAVYGEEVRSSMVSAIEKINGVAEDAESTVEGFSLGVTQAISNANTAASVANTAASNANTKATAANTAATNANTARTAANNAATAANNAASAATTTNTNITNAESARVTAEQARATAESARQANEQSRQTAETARVNAESARASAESSRASTESQRQGNENTRQGNETIRQTQEGLRVSAENSRVNEFEDMQAAFADMQRQIIPQATTNTMGGVVVGDGLNVNNALLSLATTKSGSGTAVASNGAVLESVVVYGQSVQDGTPTPSEPVDVQVVRTPNLIPFDLATLKTYNTSGTWSGNVYTFRAIQATFNEDGTITLNGTVSGTYTLYLVANSNQLFLPDGSYTLTGELPGTGSDSTWYFQATTTTDSSGTVKARNRDYGSGVTFAVDSTVYGVFSYFHAATGDTFNNAVLKPQLIAGSQIKPFVPYGSIGIVVGNTAASIDLQGNVLASLPDGTRDVLTVDGAGHCVLEKRTHVWNMRDYSNATWSKSGSATNGFYISRTTLNPVAKANQYSSHYSSITTPVASTSVYFSTTNTSYLDGSFNFNLDAAVVGSTVADFKTWLSSHDVFVCAQLDAEQTIDLGYIDMPTIPEDATISVSASITPVIDAAWWERGAEAIASTVKALSERIKALEEAIAELATA